MAAARRRTRTGVPVAVIIAILTAIFASRGSRSTAPRAAPAPAAATAAAPSASSAASRDVAGEPQSAARAGGKGFRNRQRLVEHFEKHGAEFPGMNMGAYLAAAQSLRDRASGGEVLEARRADGVVTRFDRSSGAFLAVDRDGTIRTFFRPNGGESYFRRQAARPAGSGS
jgi:hypothetical protein